MKKFFNQKWLQLSVVTLLLIVFLVGGFNFLTRNIMIAHGVSNLEEALLRLAEGVGVVPPVGNIRGWFWSSSLGWLNPSCYNDYNGDGAMENCCSMGIFDSNCPAANRPVLPGGGDLMDPTLQDLRSNNKLPDIVMNKKNNLLPALSIVSLTSNPIVNPPLSPLFYTNRKTSAFTLIELLIILHLLDHPINYSANYKTSTGWLTGYAWSENVGWVCFGATCGGTAPDNNAAWACVGNYNPAKEDQCDPDCGEYFNGYPDVHTCTGSGMSCLSTNDADLIGHWRLNSISTDPNNYVDDCMGDNGNKGYLYPQVDGIPAGQEVPGQPVLNNGKWNLGLKFNGSTSYVAVPNSSSLNIGTNSLTLEAWYKCPEDALCTGLHINPYTILEKDDGSRGYSLKIISDGRANCHVGDGSGNLDITSATPVNDGDWHHIACTVDRASGRGIIYIDGLAGDGVGAFFSDSIDNNNNLTFGASVTAAGATGSSAGNFLHGNLDNIAIWKRAKSATEIWQDSHIEVSGWAKVVTLGGAGWMKLRCPNTSDDTRCGNDVGSSIPFGTSLRNYSAGGNFYAFEDFSWQSEGNEEYLKRFIDQYGRTGELVGHWKMNETSWQGTPGEVTDSSYNQNNGVASGASTIFNSHFGRAGDFSGSTDKFVSVSNSSSLSFDENMPLTIEAWVNLTGTPETRASIVSKVGGESEVAAPFNLFVDHSGTPVLNIGDGSNEISSISQTPLGSGWHFVAATYNNMNGVIQHYVDGVSAGQSVVNPIVPYLDQHLALVIGKNINSSSGASFPGLIDNIAIYKGGVKSEADINADYRRGWGWGSDKPSGEGWDKGGYPTPQPHPFDTFHVTNYGCNGIRPNLYLHWSPSEWAEYYKYYRVQEASSSLCPDTCYGAEGGIGYTEYPIPDGACSGDSCSFLDNNGTIEQNKGYCYCVRAFNNKGNPKKTWAQDNPPTYPVPYWKMAPFCPVSAVAVDGSICGYNKVMWQPDSAISQNADGYNIYRSLTYNGCGTGSTLTELASAVTAGTCEVVAHAGEALYQFDSSTNDSIMGWWKMNETNWNGQSQEVIDSSNNNNNATSHSADTVAAGKFQRAGSFNGSAYLEAADSASLSVTGDLTIEGWIWPSSGGGDQTLLAKWDEGANKRSYRLWMDSSKHLDLSVSSDGTQSMTMVSPDSLQAEQWQHVAGVYSTNGNLTLFVNGKQVITGGGGPTSIKDTDSVLYLAAKKGDSQIDTHYNGFLDNFALYNRAKNNTEILRDAEAFPLNSLVSGNSNTCNVISDLPIYCQNSGAQTCNNCQQGWCLSCTGAQPCCRYVDRRIVPNIAYFYRTTILTKNGGESSPSEVPTDHSTGCIHDTSKENYRHACDLSTCFPGSKIEEK